MKLTYQIDGKPVEIEIADEQITAAGYQPTANFESELSRRGLSIAKKQGYIKPEDMTPEQILALAGQKGVKLETQAPDAGETATAISQAVQRNRAEWETRELNPLKAKVDELTQTEQDLLQQKLYGSIIAAAAAVGVKKSLLKAPTKNSEPPIVSMLASAFGYDTDTRQFLVLSDDGEGFAFSDRPTQDHPYQDPEEFLERWASNKENLEFIEVTAQRGPNLQGAGGGGRGNAGAVHISKADSRNLRVLEAAKAEAKKRGLDPYDGGVVVD